MTNQPFRPEEHCTPAAAEVDRERRDEIGRAIVAGYVRIPQDDDPTWPNANAAVLIAEEPW
jgi:hypothetical protein